jgi:uncharacterized protein YodC (DUF2158 family)
MITSLTIEEVLMADFNAGDTVVLKSGSPEMTISRIEEMNGVPHAVCVWFDGKKKEVGTFPVTSLRRS